MPGSAMKSCSTVAALRSGIRYQRGPRTLQPRLGCSTAAHFDVAVLIRSTQPARPQRMRAKHGARIAGWRHAAIGVRAGDREGC